MPTLDETISPGQTGHIDDHEELHIQHNKFDWDTTPPDGGVWFYNETLGKWVPLDPNIEGSPGPPGTPGPFFRLMGVWDIATAYVNNSSFIDVVSWEGSSYAALTNTTGDQPPSAEWFPMAEKGETGTAGADGADGVDGTPGAPGPPGEPGPSEEAVESTLTGSAKTADGDTFSVFFWTLDDDCDITINSTTPPQWLTIYLKQDATGGRTITWTDTIAWEGGVEPTWSTDPGALDIITITVQPDGALLGTAILNFLPVAPAAPDLSVSVIASLQSSTDSTSYQLSPPGGSQGDPITGVQAGDLLMLAIENSRTGSLDTDIPTPSGLAAWELLDPTDGTNQYFSGTTRFRLTVFAFRVTTAPAAAPVTITFPNVAAGCSATLVRIPGTSLSSLATAKAKVNKNSGTGSSVSVTLASAGDPANRPIAFIAVNKQPPAITPRANWTELLEVGHPTPSNVLQTQWRSDSFETTASGSWTEPQVSGIIATELEQG